MNYVRLTKSLYDKGKLVSESEVQDLIDLNSDWYRSIYRYTDKQKEQFQKNGTVIGIEDVKTNQLVFDFDDENLDSARSDAMDLVQTLEKAGINGECIQSYFSGNKGFHIIVELDKELTPDETKTLAIDKYGKGLQTLDVRVYNPSRIFRIENTKHQTSKLYKIPLKKEELATLNEKVIRAMAKKPRKLMDSYVAKPDASFYELPKTVEPKPDPTTLGSVDLSDRPKGWADYKWSLVQGEFKKGERHDAMMVIAATCKGQAYTKEMAYYMCKSALKKSNAKYGTGETTSDDIWNNVVGSIYSPNWKGGQYSADNNPWLKQYCEKNGFNVTETEDQFGILSSSDIAKSFVRYLKNIDELTIKTGIPQIDAKVRLSVGNSIGIVAAPSVGKTSLAIQILNQANKENYTSAFFSLDMFRDLVGQKLAQKHTGKTEEQLRTELETEGYEKEIQAVFENEYGNVNFIDRSALTIDEMRKILYYLKDNSENPLRLVVVDYNELVATDLSDSTASTAKVAQELRGLAKELEICMVVLYQPNKMTGSPSDPIKSYRSIKGSSAIEQAASIVIGMYRPGFNPEYPEDDKFMCVRVLKNRMGQLASFDLYWEGLTGNIRELLPEEKKQLDNVRARKVAEEQEKDNGWK